MRFVSRSDVRPYFEGKRVAVVGSGPGCLNNEPGFIDGHEVVVRVNNYKLSEPAGFRTDVYYSFFGSSCRKTADELKHDGVTLCLCKLPNAKAMESEWHRRQNKEIGVDFRPHYRRREGFWFCDTHIPTLDEFLESFRLLGDAMPTTGFAAILEVLQHAPASVYLTGFDFFASGVHNVNEPWRAKNLDDPFRHRPEREAAWIKTNMRKYPIMIDDALGEALLRTKAAA